MKRRLRILLGFLATATLVAPPLAAAPSETPACQVPVALVNDTAALPNVAARLAARQPVTIVAIGSASTAGVGGTGAESAFPTRLHHALRERFGVLNVVVNLAAPRLSAADWLARLRSDVLAPRPDLVIWETGTVDAVRGVDPNEYRRVMSTGIAELKQSKVDVIIVDPQYSKRLSMMINIGPLIDTLKTIANLEEIVYFDRYEIMKYWAESGYFQFQERMSVAAMAENDRIFECIGALLAYHFARALGLKEIVASP